MKYVIGDIHGENKKLNELLYILDKNATEYIFLGDYVDKGENSKEVIFCLTSLSKVKKCTFLMGDHEYAWIQYFAGEDRFLDFLVKYGGIKTLESYMGRKLTPDLFRSILLKEKEAKEILSELLDFFETLKFYHIINEDFLGVHAGVEPENKKICLDKHNQEKMVFIRKEFINSKFLFKGRKIIFGHTAWEKPFVDKYKIGIDTGAVYENEGLGDLTAFDVINKRFINHKGEIKKCRNI
ncbi:MAG: serine/threonine protein phosphatase, partial [Candidatus Omnitrophica bacterium]|nr:serine/threonine protein phosphatase [Candidatus Omnitrophota bacterium]